MLRHQFLGFRLLVTCTMYVSCSKNHFDKRKQVQAAATSKAWSDSGTASFSALQFSTQKEALFIYLFLFYFFICLVFSLNIAVV